MKTTVHLIGLLLSLSVITQAQHPTAHPRLFFAVNDTAAISARTRVPGSAASQLFSELVQSASHYVLGGYMWHDTTGNLPLRKHDYYENLPGIAFLYLVTHQQVYANRAIDLVFRADPVFERQGILYDHWPGGGRGLRKKVLTLAIVYDFLHEQLDANQRRAIQDSIIAGLAYPGYEGIREYYTRPDIDILRHEEHPGASLLFSSAVTATRLILAP